MSKSQFVPSGWLMLVLEELVSGRGLEKAADHCK